MPVSSFRKQVPSRDIVAIVRTFNIASRNFIQRMNNLNFLNCTRRQFFGVIAAKLIYIVLPLNSNIAYFDVSLLMEYI